MGQSPYVQALGVQLPECPRSPFIATLSIPSWPLYSSPSYYLDPQTTLFFSGVTNPPFLGSSSGPVVNKTTGCSSPNMSAQEELAAQRRRNEKLERQRMKAAEGFCFGFWHNRPVGLGDLTGDTNYIVSSDTLTSNRGKNVGVCFPVLQIITHMSSDTFPSKPTGKRNTY